MRVDVACSLWRKRASWVCAGEVWEEVKSKRKGRDGASVKDNIWWREGGDLQAKRRNTLAESWLDIGEFIYSHSLSLYFVEQLKKSNRGRII